MTVPANASDTQCENAGRDTQINTNLNTLLDPMLDAALDAMANSNAAAAVKCFESVLEIVPDHTEARHGLVRALEDTGRIDDALRVAEELIAANPDDVLAVTRLSMLYQHKGMVPEAEAAAARAKILGWKQELRSGVTAKTTL
jgi:tetratricopeptide (TPR) repeat protein